MSHIVIHEDNENITHYRQFDDVQDAATYLEELHNVEGLAGARLFALEEVQFAVTSYVKVEIAASTETAAAPLATADESADAAIGSFAGEVMETPDGAEVVEYVEAAMAPVDAFAPTPAGPGPEPTEEPVGGGEVRRGLFGR